MTSQELNRNDLKEIEELECILSLYQKAKGHLQTYNWCNRIIKGWYDFESGVYEKLAVFLFEIEPANDTIDSFIWIINGDLPTVYLDQSVKTARDALIIYCELMDEWATNIKEGRSIKECYPVLAEPTIENAELLEKRIEFIRREIISNTQGEQKT